MARVARMALFDVTTDIDVLPTFVISRGWIYRPDLPVGAVSSPSAWLRPR